jgi:DNA-binding GntR family transcriptional regulator
MIDDSSITQKAYLQLKSDLVACRLTPGKRINISQIQRETAFSQAAVREALSRLASEGLVDIERNAGFKASPISRTGFRELSEASMTIEIPCLRIAIENGDLEWEGKLVATYHMSSKMLTEVVSGREELDKYTAHREAFYDALLAPCDNKWLLKSWKTLYIQQMRYRHTFRKLAEYESSLTDYYKNFIDAILERDVERAVTLCLDKYEKVIAFVEGLDGAGDLHTQTAVGS